MAVPRGGEEIYVFGFVSMRWSETHAPSVPTSETTDRFSSAPQII